MGPLVISPPADCNCGGMMSDLWGTWFTLLAFMILIKPLRERLAKPVGIWFRSHKYSTRSCFNPRKYTRSWEGSGCVFLYGLIFHLVQNADFDSSTQMWLAADLLAPCTTVAEATSPHTMDTPFLMGSGGLAILLVVHFVQ